MKDYETIPDGELDVTETESGEAAPVGGEDSSDLIEAAEADSDLVEVELEISEQSAEEELVPDAEETPAEEEYLPRGRFDKVLYSVYRDEGLTAILKLISAVSVIATVYALFYRMALLVADGAYLKLLYLSVLLLAPFVLVTAARRLIDAKRPYELFEFYKTPPKNKKGQSFPSRHVFSIFAIGVALCYFSLTLGIIITLLGVLLSACRVLLGYHFIRDTVAGAVIGAISGGITLLTLYLA